MRLGLILALMLSSTTAFGGTCDENSARWSPALEVASRILNASIEAERQARRDFQSQLEQGRLSQREIQDYRFYLEDLERLVRTNTQAVERLRCFTVQASPEPEMTEPGGLFQTQEEARDELDAELSASLSQFDEVLLRETEEARSSPRSTSWSAQSGAFGASGQESGAQSTGAVSQASSASASGIETSERTSKNTGETSERVASARGAAGMHTGTTPQDIPDGGDDDIVARQLREAAENEPDPVLREKLWAEYRKYKNGQ